MSVAYGISAQGLVYTVVDDLTTYYWAVIVGTVEDEIFGGLLPTSFRLEADRPDLRVRTLPNGLFALAGYPEIAFPKLISQSYPVNLVISSPGYRDFPIHVTIPVNATFPVVAPTAKLRRLPVRVQGRVVKASDRSSISGAKVTTVNEPGVPPPLQQVAALRTPLYFAHAAGVKAQDCQLSPTGSLKQLSVRAAARTTVLSLTNRAGLSPGNPVLRIGGDPLTDPQVEFAVVDSLVPPVTNLNLPGDVILRSGLNHSFPTGTSVQMVTPSLLATTRTLQLEADAGDGVLILDGLLNVDTIEIIDPDPLRVEYHAVGALSDADGFYRLDGVGRQVTFFLNAAASGLTDSTLPLGLNYSRPVNLLDFRLS